MCRLCRWPGRRRGSRRPATSRWWWSLSWRWRRTGRSGTCSPGSGIGSSGAPPGQRHGGCQHNSAASLYTRPWVRSGKEWRGGWRPGTECPLYTGRTAAGWTNCSWTWIKTRMSKYLRSFKLLNQRSIAFISCTRYWQSLIHLISVYR